MIAHLAALLALFPGLALAETVLLKSGEKVVGKISHADEKEIEMQVPISAAIFDTRTISRSEIQEIEQPDPSSKDFAALKSICVLPNSLPSQDYDFVLAKLGSFLSKFPQSPHLSAVQEIMGNLSTEKERVISGERKIADEWFTSFELQQEKDQINATLAYQEFLNTADKDLIDALNLFARFEKTYPGAKTLPKAVEKARELIGRVQQIAEPNLKGLPERMAAREAGWQLAGEPQRSQLRASATAEDKAIQDEIAVAKGAGDLWMPLFPNHKISLEAILTTAKAEAKRLAAVPVASLSRSVQLSDQGRVTLKDGNLAEAANLFAESAALWPANLMNRRNIELLTAARKAAEATPKPKKTEVP